MLKFYTILPDNDHVGGARQATKISIALKEMDEEFETIDLDRRREVRPLGTEYRKNVNPNGRVPAIDDGGFIMWEAGAILNYLVESRPLGQRIMPTETQARARVQQWTYWEGTTVTPDMITLMALVIGSDPQAFGSADTETLRLAAGCSYLPLMGGPNQERALAYAKDQYHRDLEILDGALRGKDYVVDDFSIADIALGVAIPIPVLSGFDYKRYGNVVRWLNRLEQRPSFRATPSFVNHMQTGRAKGLM